jgi:hypothetical protein
MYGNQLAKSSDICTSRDMETSTSIIKRISRAAFGTCFCVGATMILAGCSPKVMEPTESNFAHWSEQVQQVGLKITAKERKEADSNRAAKLRLMRALYMDTFDSEGYDFDATVKDYAIRTRDGNYTQGEDGQVIAVFLYSITPMIDDLVEAGVVSEETRSLVNSLKAK